MSMKAAPSFSLKDQLFNPEKVEYLATLIGQVYPAFAQQTFQQEVVRAFPELELKERIAHITTCLHNHLPKTYAEALPILLDALPPPLDPSKSDDDFGDFIFAPLSLFVATYGCTTEHLAISLQALKAMTTRFSAEDAIRYFINTFPDETMAFLTDCAADDNYHIRRLASEGTRPKLPWAQKLTIHYSKPLSILDALHADPTRYVTRSVANHLNDISKLDPDLVINTLQRWQGSQRQREKEMAFITKHALRTLVKQGNQDALALLGFGEAPDVNITTFATTTPQVKIGDALEFSLTMHAKKQQKLLVDYQMEFASEGNKRSQKVFKLKQLELEAGEVVTINKKHPMRLMTTRRLVPGEHRVILLVNGQVCGSLTFDLTEA